MDQEEEEWEKTLDGGWNHFLLTWILDSLTFPLEQQLPVIEEADTVALIIFLPINSRSLIQDPHLLSLPSIEEPLTVRNTMSM